MKIEESRIKKPSVIILDWDDTIVNSGEALKIAFEEVVKEMGLTYDKNNIKRYRHYYLKDSIPKLFTGDADAIKDAYDKKVTEITKNNVIEILPGALESLQILVKTGTALCVVSNKFGETLRDEINKLNLSHYFDSIIGAEDAKRAKPWSDPVDLALKNVDINKRNGEKWFIGDSVADIECAHNTNSMPFLIGDKTEAIEQLKILQLEYFQLKDHRELHSIINKIF